MKNTLGFIRVFLFRENYTGIVYFDTKTRQVDPVLF